MSKLLNNLKDYFNNNPKDKLDRDWEEIKYLNEDYNMEELKIDKEYQKVIDTLELVKNKVSQTEKSTISDCQHVIKQLGSRVILSEDAEAFNDITKTMLKTYIKKNHDYGNSFEQSLDEFGLVAGIIRIGDKVNRLKSLIKKDALVMDESIRDTLLDTSNYCILSTMWLDKNKNNNELL